MTRPDLLAPATVAAWLDANPQWSLRNGHLVREQRFASHRDAAQFVLDQVTLAERLDHHPVITLTYRDVRWELWTHDRGGVTTLDLAYAEAVDAAIVNATRF